eukprot:COSAG02_NODE_3469_length_6691_cov_9.305218_5_plen_270_part_00
MERPRQAFVWRARLQPLLWRSGRPLARTPVFARVSRPAVQNAQLAGRCWKSGDASLQSSRIVSAAHRELVNSQRSSLVSLQGQLGEMDGAADDLELLSSTIAHLDELFLLCIVGEFNAGKSSLINALLGGRHLEDGVTPTTDRVYLIKQSSNDCVGLSGGDTATRRGRSELSGSISTTAPPPPTTIELPVPWLEDVTLVDTPGTNAVVQGHTEITEAIVPRCDLLLFVTSVDRPISVNVSAACSTRRATLLLSTPATAADYVDLRSILS